MTTRKFCMFLHMCARAPLHYSHLPTWEATCPCMFPLTRPALHPSHLPQAPNLSYLPM